jgi:hypothetical protein
LSILNNLAKHVLEYDGMSGKTKVRGKFTEVGGPFSSQLKARQCKWLLEGKR